MGFVPPKKISLGGPAPGLLQLHVHNVIPCLHPLPTEPSPEGHREALRLFRNAWHSKIW